MTLRPPTRLAMRMLLLAVALVAASCGSVRPTPSPAGTTDVVGPTVPPATAVAPAGPRFAGLLTLEQGQLLLLDADGLGRPVAGPGAPVEAVSAARGTIVARTAGPTFHLATASGNDVDHLDWRTIELDPAIGRRPLSSFALAPDGSSLAILAAEFGSGEPFEVVLVAIETRATRVVPVDLEPNGPPVWLDPSTVLLEIIPGAAGGPFLRLDVGTGAVEGVRARGFEPAIAGDGAAVAVLGAVPEPAVRVLPVSDWLDGAELETGGAVGGPVNALHVAINSAGNRVAFDAADVDGTPVSLSVYARDEGGWFLSDVIEGDPPRWFGWLH